MSNSKASEPATERTLRSSTRTNPRRRQRQSDNDTLPAKAPKRRRRNKVEDETFQPQASTEDASTQSQTQPAAEDNITLMNGHIHPTAEKSSAKGTPTLDGTTTIRGRVKRTIRGDNATVLAHNQCYTVKLLPSTPKELRKEGVEYRGTLGPHNNALAITHEKALIWDYNAHLAATNPRTFDVPFPTKDSDPLPFGALISNSASTTDIGLLLVSATTGNVVFYESIDRAASLGLFQGRKAGVEGSIGNLFSGETVAELVSADHAGFVVVLSSGRLAQLTLRDGQGKAKIWSQFLRATEPNSGGLFGSFSSFWSGGLRKDVTAVHTRPLNVRGQMQAVALTERGEVLVWDLEWSGRADFKASLQFDEVLSNELKQLDVPEISSKADKLTALDFAILDKSGPDGNEVATVGAEQPLSIAVLVRVGPHDMHTYVLAELALIKDRVLVGRVTQLTSYEGRGDVRYQAKPKLILPKPGHTVYIAFEDATILMDARDPASENPDAQLHGDESFIEPEAYEESIYLRQGRDLAIQSTFEEEAKGNQSSCVAFVKSAGLVRIAATDVQTLGASWKISAKSRIEQGVFYGSLQPDNILDFSRRAPSKSSPEEVANAALVVSEEIVHAETPFTSFISPSPTSMEQHLATKAKALKALVTFVRQNYPALSRSTMWRLLWNAERVAIGQQLWIAFEEHVVMSSDKGKRKATLLDEMCSWFEEAAEHNPYVVRPDLKDEEPVRKFFIGGLYRLEKLLSNVRSSAKSLEEDDNTMTPQGILRTIVQANDVWLKTFEKAFIFRSEHCADYGILPELIDEGVLVDPAEYTDVPEFWTSAGTQIENTAKIAEVSREFAKKFYEDMKDDPEVESFSREIAENNPRLVQLYCQQSQEGINWQASRPSQQNQQQAAHLKAEYELGRFNQCRSLAEIGQAEAGMHLAEKFRDMNILTYMMVAEDQYLEEEYNQANELQKQVIQTTRNDLQAKVRKLFDRYGSLWADAFFDRLFSGTNVGNKLVNAQKEWGPALDKYLRASPSRAKICWINDVTKNGDFAHAAKALAQAAKDHEGRLWAKKVELSMSKLALMAAEETGSRSKSARLSLGSEVKDFNPENGLQLTIIQEALYRHLEPTLYGAIDETAKIELLAEKYANHVADYPALRKLLENDLVILCEHTVLNVEQLIDILTLIDIKQDKAQDYNLDGAEFAMALHVLNNAVTMLPTDRFDLLLKIVWKRCYIYDDWATEVNLSGKKSDSERKAILRSTVVWNTMYQIVKAGGIHEGEDHVQVLAPRDCLGAGCSPQDLAYRFPDEDLLDPILHDCKIQDELLQSFVEDRHLDDVAEECLRDAEAYVEAEKQEFRREMQHRPDPKQHNRLLELNGHEANGHPTGPNGFHHEDEDALME